MNRIDRCFAGLKQRGRKALISFITAGDPVPEISVDILHALAAGGADILELGIPFSDPGADGRVIQGSNERALAHGVGIPDVLAMVAEFRKTDDATPIVLMGYLNPVENIGYDNFTRRAQKAGVDGVITVDLPPEESADFDRACAQYGIYPVYLVSPTTTEERIKQIVARSRGFVYYVAVKGVTGDKVPEFAELDLAKVRKYTDLPLALGFGIKDHASITAAWRHADAAVVGSTIVSIIANNRNLPEIIPAKIGEFIRNLRKDHEL